MTKEEYDTVEEAEVDSDDEDIEVEEEDDYEEDTTDNSDGQIDWWNGSTKLPRWC